MSAVLCFFLLFFPLKRQNSYALFGSRASHSAGIRGAEDGDLFPIVQMWLEQNPAQESFYSSRIII